MNTRSCLFLCSVLTACSGSGADELNVELSADASAHDSGAEAEGDASEPSADAGEDAGEDGDAGGAQTDASSDTDGACMAGDCCQSSDCAEGFLCGEDHRCLDVAGSLAGLSWKLPCTGSKNTEACANGPDVDVAATLGGTEGVVYDVRLHFRGVVEAKTYLEGCSTPDDTWQVGGTPASDTGNIYRLEISSPAQTYYLNRGVSADPALLSLDFEQTVRMAAGATVTLYAASIDGAELLNIDGPNAPVSVSGAQVAQPYDGQFVEMQVVSVTPDALQARPEGSPSTALAFNGNQFASVPDAPSLRPSDVTLEAWFRLSGTSPGYTALMGKPLGNSTADSYTVWFQSGALYGGGNLTSVSGAATAAWSVDAQTFHHVAMVFDSAAQRARLYVDGVLRSCAPAAPPVAYDTHPFYLGGDVDYGAVSGLWQGAIDEARVFSSVRSAQQIWEDMHSATPSAASTLVGAWSFEEGTGQVAADSSGSGNDALLGTSDSVEASDPTWIQVTLPR